MDLKTLLYNLPPFIDVQEIRLFLHLQPWSEQEGWNAFYGSVDAPGWAISTFRESGATPEEACGNLLDLIALGRFSLDKDTKGLTE